MLAGTDHEDALRFALNESWQSRPWIATDDDDDAPPPAPVPPADLFEPANGTGGDGDDGGDDGGLDDLIDMEQRLRDEEDSGAGGADDVDPALLAEAEAAAAAVRSTLAPLGETGTTKRQLADTTAQRPSVRRRLDGDAGPASVPAGSAPQHAEQLAAARASMLTFWPAPPAAPPPSSSSLGRAWSVL